MTVPEVRRNPRRDRVFIAFSFRWRDASLEGLPTTLLYTRRAIGGTRRAERHAPRNCRARRLAGGGYARSGGAAPLDGLAPSASASSTWLFVRSGSSFSSSAATSP